MLNISTVMRETGMELKLLGTGMIENMRMYDLDKSLLILNRRKCLGVRIAIDNFGAGYSSLSILKQFALDTIKIDGTYIRAIIAMAKVLALTVVAAGVETREQADMLDKNAGDDFLGFYFSEPIPAVFLTALLRAQSAAATATVPAPA